MSDFDWGCSYSVPTDLRLRITPTGDLQVDGPAAHRSVEVPATYVELLLAFARPQTATAGFAHAHAQWQVDRDAYGQLLESWVAQGLLLDRDRETKMATRLALFARAIEEHRTSSPPRFPLRSHFELQRPLVFYPGLDTREIHDAARFAWVADLEGSFATIQAEFSRLAAGGEFLRVHREQTSTGEWAAAYLWAFGKKVEACCGLCPETTRLLSAIPGVAEFGTTTISALAPHSSISPHYGFTNAKLRCQLPLQVPQGCKLKVGDREVEQRKGRCIVFDDSFLHSAWNQSDETRFVLVFDFSHPDLAPEELAYLIQLAQDADLGTSYLRQAASGGKVDWVDGQAGPP